MQVQPMTALHQGFTPRSRLKGGNCDPTKRYSHPAGIEEGKISGSVNGGPSDLYQVVGHLRRSSSSSHPSRSHPLHRRRAEAGQNLQAIQPSVFLRCGPREYSTSDGWTKQSSPISVDWTQEELYRIDVPGASSHCQRFIVDINLKTSMKHSSGKPPPL